MPFFKMSGKLVYYAPVPKCGGAVVDGYLADRFGPAAFQDTQHTRLEPQARWSRTSPQHIDRDSLARLFPKGVFDATFSVVRHPVERIIRVYQFQLEVERLIPSTTSFSEWVQDIAELRAENPFTHDNHVRPMSEIVPEGAQLFYMEHGLEPMIAWLDQISGQSSEPGSASGLNAQLSSNVTLIEPTEYDLVLIGELYGEDFSRFGYSLREKMPRVADPAAPVPEPPTGHRETNLVTRLTRKLVTKIGL